VSKTFELSTRDSEVSKEYDEDQKCGDFSVVTYALCPRYSLHGACLDQKLCISSLVVVATQSRPVLHKSTLNLSVYPFFMHTHDRVSTLSVSFSTEPSALAIRI